MPKYVEVGQDVVEFPDNMSDADIEKVLSAQFGRPAASPTAAPTAATQPNAPEKRSVWDEAGRQLGLTVRAGLSSVAAIPAMLAEPVAGIVNDVAGRRVLGSPTKAFQDVLTMVGLPEPKGTLERAVQAGTQAGFGTGLQAGVAQVSKLPTLAPLAREVPQQLAASTAAAGAAQATSDRAQEVGFSPTEAAAASLAVGTLAGLVGAKAVRSTTKTATPQVTMEDVKREAGRAYTRVDNAGISVKPQPLLNTLDDIESNLIKNQNFNPQLDSHKPVKQILDQLRSMVGTQRVSFSKMDQLRQAANDLARESKDPATRRLAALVVDGIDKKITGLQPTDLVTGKTALPNALKDVKEARDAWRRVSKANILEDALNVAEARALDPKASEGELIRTQFKALAANKDKMRLFSKDEQEAIRRVVSGEGVEKILSFLARFNPERSQLMTGATVGASFANPFAAAGVAAGGFAADKALAALQQRAAKDVIAQILSGQIRKPRDVTAWRALIEARARELQQEEQPTE